MPWRLCTCSAYTLLVLSACATPATTLPEARIVAQAYRLGSRWFSYAGGALAWRVGGGDAQSAAKARHNRVRRGAMSTANSARCRVQQLCEWQRQRVFESLEVLHDD